MPRRLRLAAALALAGATATALAPSAGARRYVHVNVGQASRCDFLVSARCLLPWPNDYFTVADRKTPTGRRIHINRLATPANTDGVHIDPTDYNRADGFSPGQEIVVKVPGLDSAAAFTKTKAVPQTDMAQAFAKAQPVVVVDAATRKRHLIWAELDSTAASNKDRALLIRPGVNWQEGHRYIVALRNLKNVAGRILPAPLAFRVYRDGLATRQRPVERRRAHMESLFRTLGRAGISRRTLYLAWDFTVASRQSLAGRMLAIRDDAFKALGDTNLADRTVQGSAPQFTVDPPDSSFSSSGGTWTYSPCDPSGCQPGQDDKVAMRITGTFTVPCYLDQTGCPPGAKFHYAPGSSTPSQIAGNTYSARFVCKVPRASAGGPPQTMNRPSIYGHGLLGSANEVNQQQVSDMIFEHHFVYCATNWIGLSSEDVPNDVAVLKDLSKFPTVGDRLQEGMLAALYLSRLEIHPQGLASNPAFQVGGVPVIDTASRGYYDGNSQGGIMGGGLTAVAPDFDHAALGVPGMNYSTLLQRSVDFNSYATILYGAYPDNLDRPIYLSLLQMLWDRGEADGYAQHMTSDPLPGTPPHQVLMQAAVGDHQVANVSAEVEARTIGASLYVPALDPGRSLDKTPFYAIPRIGSYPFAGSALTMFDSGPLRANNTLGTPAAPAANLPPALGQDPHEFPRRTVQGRQQKSDFLSPNGKVTQACGARPCYSDDWTGP